MADTNAGDQSVEQTADPAALPVLALRSVLGGVLMGLANLVPGISGGTMLLASGVYPRFIGAIAELTTLRVRFRSVLVLGAVIASALVAIGLLAGAVKGLVVDHRWIMYSIFIGLTLGGVPVVWQLIRKADRSSRDVGLGSVAPAVAAGFAVMAAVAWLQSRGAAGGGGNDGFAFMLVAGMVGASAMILPGVSGGYLFLVMGVYVPVLSGIDAVMQAVGDQNWDALVEPMRGVVLPVGIGVVLGVVLVSNALRWMLKRYEKATLGFLLGLLIGAVVGLWPFQEGVKPQVGQVIKGRTMTAELIEVLPADDYPTAYFRPGIGQVAGAVGLIAAGFAATALIARIGGDRG